MTPGPDLLEAWIRGELPSERMPELEAWIAADALHADAAMHAIHHERALAAALRGREARRAAGFPSQRSPMVRVRRSPGRAARHWLVATVAVAALIAISLILLRQPGQGRVALDPTSAPVAVLVSGEMGVEDAGGLHPAPANAAVGPNQFCVGRRAAVLRLVAGGAEVALMDGARASFSSGQPAVMLESGGLDARVAPRPAGTPFVIRTPHGVITVLGTRFRVVVEGTNTRVSVSEGRVALVAGDGSRLEVSAGGSAMMRAAPPSGPRLEPIVRLDFVGGTGNLVLNSIVAGPAIGIMPEPGEALRWEATGLRVSSADRIWSRDLADGALLARLQASDQVTLSAWIRADSELLAGPYHHVAELIGPSAAGKPLLVFQLAKPAGTALSGGAWHHLAATSAAGEIRTYLDGALCHRDPIAWSPAHWGKWIHLKLLVPRDHASVGYLQPLVFSRLCIHDYAMTGVEIAAEVERERTGLPGAP